MKSGTCIYFKGGNTLSLLNNGSCCGNNGTARRSNGVVADLLDQLANGACGNYCMMTQQPVIRVILKGTEEPLDVNANEFGTDFTLVRYDAETYATVLGYTIGVAPNAVTRTVVLDSRCICGVICLTPTPAAPGVLG